MPAAPAGADPAEDLSRAQEAHALADAEFKSKDAEVAKATATYNAAERAAQQAEGKAQGSAQAKAKADAAVKEAAAANDAYQKDAADADSAGITVLKKGWEAVSDPRSGTYYYNAATQETLWDAPTETIADIATVKKDASNPVATVAVT